MLSVDTIDNCHDIQNLDITTSQASTSVDLLTCSNVRSIAPLYAVRRRGDIIDWAKEAEFPV